jgi:Ca2+-binding EF-hand superfamily protein
VTRVLLEINPMDEIQRVFELIDSDKTGSINAQQLQKVMEATGEHPPLSEAEAMIHEAANTHSDKGAYLVAVQGMFEPTLIELRSDIERADNFLDVG